MRAGMCRKAPASCMEAGGSGAFPLTGDERPGAELGATYIRADPSPPQQRGSGGTVPFRTAPTMGGIRYKKLVLPRLEVPCLPKLS